MDIKEFITQIGCADKDSRIVTFVRVFHKPTSKERVVVGIGDEDAFMVQDRLIKEIEDEILREA